jgi:hypothetical protein
MSHQRLARERVATAHATPRKTAIFGIPSTRVAFALHLALHGNVVCNVRFVALHGVSWLAISQRAAQRQYLREIDIRATTPTSPPEI